MKQFTFSDLHRLSGEILEAAIAEPIALTKHGKKKVIMVPAEEFDRLTGRAARAKSYSLLDAPDDVHEDLMTGIRAILDNPAKNV